MTSTLIAQPAVSVSTLIAIDPGTYGFGLAVFTDGVLTHADYYANPSQSFGGLESTMAAALVGVPSENRAVACEYPQVYVSGRVNPNNLVTLGISAGTLTTAVRAQYVAYYYPREWTRGLEKKKRWDVVSALLTDQERATVGAPGPKLDTYDAVGIGLRHLGRFR